MEKQDRRYTLILKLADSNLKTAFNIVNLKNNSPVFYSMWISSDKFRQVQTSFDNFICNHSFRIDELLRVHAKFGVQ